MLWRGAAGSNCSAHVTERSCNCSFARKSSQEKTPRIKSSPSVKHNIDSRIQLFCRPTLKPIATFRSNFIPAALVKHFLQPVASVIAGHIYRPNSSPDKFIKRRFLVLLEWLPVTTRSHGRTHNYKISIRSM